MLGISAGIGRGRIWGKRICIKREILRIGYLLVEFWRAGQICARRGVFGREFVLGMGKGVAEDWFWE